LKDSICIKKYFLQVSAISYSSISVGLSISGSVRFWTKINNQTELFFFNFLNRTEPKTGSNRLISVRFGSVFFPSKPVQTQWSSTNTSNIPPSVLDHWLGLWLFRKQYSSPQNVVLPSPNTLLLHHLSSQMLKFE